MINNRQNGRRRGRGGGQRSQGGSGQGGQRDSGNRIDSRARGNASQLYEKYKNMASDAQRQGDRVNTEYYLQFADHYFRVIADQRGRYEDQGQRGRASNDFDGDDDYGDEGDPIRGDEQLRGEIDQDARNDRSQGDRGQGDRESGSREGGYRDGGQRYDRDNYQREGGQRYDRQRDESWRDGQREAQRDPRDRGQSGGYDRGNSEPRPAPQPRTEQIRTEQARAEQPRMDQARDDQVRDGQPRSDRRPVYANDEQVGATADVAAEPRRRGRPRKQVSETDGAAPMLDASVLPPSLGIGTPMASGDDDAPAPKPRRRRAAGEATQAG